MEQVINKLAKFLAHREIEQLDVKHLYEKYGINKVDAIFVFGNDLPEVIKCASKAYLAGLTDWLVICGGVGHSTIRLQTCVAESKKCPVSEQEAEGLSEAEIYSMIAKRCYDVPSSQMLLDTKSTNSGENAINGMKLLEEAGIEAKNVILMQDPVMQLRATASLKRYAKDLNIISYAPFIPEVDEQLHFTMGVSDVWGKERFLELLIGEIPRLLDTKDGYGPKGMNFITHVDVPEEIVESWKKIKDKFEGLASRSISDIN